MLNTEPLNTARRSFLSLLAGGIAAPAISTPAFAQEKGAVKIGTVLSVTGPGAFLGDHMRRGTELAIDDINARGGINGRKIAWTFYDAGTETTKGVLACRRLIDQDGVDIIVGGGNASGIALAMVPLCNKAGMPFISTEGSAEIVKPVAERHWIFKSTLDDDQALERAADFWQKRNITSVALLHDSSGFGQSAKDQLQKIAQQRNLKVVYESFNPTDTDLTAQLVRLKNTDGKAILCWTITPTGVVFMKQAREANLGDRMLMHSYGFVDDRYMKLAGPAADGVYLLSTKFPVADQLPADDPVRAKGIDLAKRYEARYKLKPNQFVAQTYDAVHLAAQGLAAGANDRAKVRDNIEAIRRFDGVGGSFGFSPSRHTGLDRYDAVIIQWRNENDRFNLADYQKRPA